jgi:glyoxylase-like metal-dependent hydrolase (beta-lactamase superfamily II)
VATDPAPGWTDLGGGIRVRRSRAFETNSALLLDAAHAILVDPGVLPSELDDIGRVVSEARPATLTLFMTHAHWDHVLGRTRWPEAGVIAHPRLGPELERDRAGIAREAERLAAEHGERWQAPFAPFVPDLAVSGLHFAKLGPWRAVFRDAPGHSTSQLTLHLPERRVLFAADMLSDIEIPLLDGPVAPYRETLEALLPLAEHGAIETLVPGHGSIAHGAEAALDRIIHDLGYLDALERGARAARSRGLTVEEAQSELSSLDIGTEREGPSMADAHRVNVGHAYEGIAAPPRP